MGGLGDPAQLGSWGLRLRLPDLQCDVYVLCLPE